VTWPYEGFRRALGHGNAETSPQAERRWRNVNAIAERGPERGCLGVGAMNNVDPERWKTARHEAGHAVAALHYDCPIEHVSIEAQWPALGTTHLGVSKPSDAIVIFCGPLAEKSWGEFRPGANVTFQTVGTDHEAVQYLKMTKDECSACVTEALVFMCKSEVQQQIDRVARALLDRNKLTIEDVRAAAAFSVSLASDGWLP
jgi:hypothetical protein